MRKVFVGLISVILLGWRVAGVVAAADKPTGGIDEVPGVLMRRVKGDGYKEERLDRYGHEGVVFSKTDGFEKMAVIDCKQKVVILVMSSNSGDYGEDEKEYEELIRSLVCGPTGN